MKQSVVIILSLGLLLIGIAFGFLIGYLSRPSEEKSETNVEQVKLEYGDPAISERLLNEISKENIREHLRILTSRPHLSGTEGDKVVVDYISNFWHDIGLDPVKIVPYTVLLSSPDTNKTNKVVIFDGNHKKVFETQPFEKILRPEQNQSDVVPPFNAYSPPGNPKGRLVYINYGRIEDFNFLTTKINLTGSICIARYGKIFRSDKVVHGQKFGCAGMIFYNDPADYAVEGVSSVYPDSWWLPGTGAQRGTIKISSGGIGDPLTPLYPAIESAYRLPVSKANLPLIPVHPIGYDDAKVLLERMSGEDVPPGWAGKLNITYRIGPGFEDANHYVQMQISTHSRLAKIYNIIGFIRGSIEPDRYVVIGNHHDAWVFGAVDPSSGTATMLELSRSIAKLASQGWKPRRTIAFCAWGAEEQGILGSREWVENFGHILRSRAVAYLNVDSAVQGSHVFRGRALPLLNQVMYDVAQVVPNPDKNEVKLGRTSLYDTWALRNPIKSGTMSGKPRIPVLGSGSDFAAFIQNVGVTSADLRFSFDEALNISSYPLYHSVYETFHLYDTYIDPGFKFSLALAQFWGELTRRLADYVILPFGVEDYATAVESYFDKFDKAYGSLLENNSLHLDYLRMAVNNFTSAAKAFQRKLSSVDKTNTLAVRCLNDQMMQLERAFIDPVGLPNRPAVKHILFAPSLHNSYAGITFPGLIDSLFEIEKATMEDRMRRWEDVKKQLSIATLFVQVAASNLAEPTEF